MMMLSTTVRVYIAAEPIDMRKSIDSLSMLVSPMFDQDALSGHVFVFYGRRRDKIKVLVYDRTGFWLMYKRFESGSLADPAAIARRGISLAELTMWLEGIDVGVRRRVRAVNATVVA
ncbi:IS66 Orf2 like protein [compost metagenome]